MDLLRRSTCVVAMLLTAMPAAGGDIERSTGATVYVPVYSQVYHGPKVRAFQIAATASVVGAIVGEISSGVGGGLGRRSFVEAQRDTTGPERRYVAVIGSAILGSFVFLIITAIERVVLTQQGREAVT